MENIDKEQLRQEIQTLETIKVRLGIIHDRNGEDSQEYIWYAADKLNEAISYLKSLVD